MMDSALLQNYIITNNHSDKNKQEKKDGSINVI
jgi:hypothetical protein